jgi:hypothetical protein
MDKRESLLLILILLLPTLPRIRPVLIFKTLQISLVLSYNLSPIPGVAITCPLVIYCIFHYLISALKLCHYITFILVVFPTCFLISPLYIVNT